jgi:hypothetical protein
VSSLSPQTDDKKKFCCLSQVMVGPGQGETAKNQTKDFPELPSEAM